jgi:hypothetical protein
MARYIWRGNGFFTVLNANDNTLKSALEHIEKQ